MGAGSDIAGSLRNPARYSGVYGHKPTWGLISTRGHAPPGIMTPTDISVVGPMARHAEDLDLALRILAGPDLLQRTAWRVELPPPRRRRLGEFRVAVWPSSPLCRIDTSVSDLFDRAIDAIVRAGATVDDKSAASSRCELSTLRVYVSRQSAAADLSWSDTGALANCWGFQPIGYGLPHPPVGPRQSGKGSSKIALPGTQI
jgi:amidase